MPSDERIIQALEALGDAKELFSSSVALSAEEVRGILERDQGANEKPQVRLGHELGPFAAGKIDLERLASFVGTNQKLEGEKRAQVEKAYDVLKRLKQAGDEIFTVRVDPDGYLRGGIVSTLARCGTAFGAARSVEWALHAIAPPETVDDPLEAFPPNRWNAAEHRCSPPIVVEVEGQDLKVGSLGELLVGTQKIVLVVNGPAAPAPLVRLITPGVAVIQTDDPADLAILGAIQGPAVAALMPEGCARFTHSPMAGKTLEERLQVSVLPDEEPKRALGGISAFQQAEELGQLAALGQSHQAVPVVEGQESEGPPDMDEAGQLASWLVSQADLAEV